MTDFCKKLTNNKSENTKSIVYKDVNKDDIGIFLKEFITFKRSVIDNLMPIKFIQEYVKNIDTNWDVVIYTGTQQDITIDKISFKAELRKSFTPNIDYIEVGQRKISSGTPELALFDDEIIKEINGLDFKKGEKTRYIRRKLKKPILMLHVLNIPSFCEKLPAFGVCFPDNGIGHSQTVEYIINSVYIKELEEQLNYEVEYDD